MNPTGTAEGANRINSLVTTLLDRGYDRAASAALRAVSASMQSGIVAQRLGELDAEAARLAAAGERLTASNPVLRALLADMEPVLRRQAARVDTAASDLQSSGVNAGVRLTRDLALPGLSDAQLRAIGILWNVPNPEAINAAVGYVEGDAWAAELSRYVGGSLETVRNQAVMGIVQGWNPVTTARHIRQMVEGVPVHRANNLMRTLQLTSYRDSTALMQRANADLIVEQIRIGTLDGRICLACIALHGTRLPAGERVDDHHQGRCVGVSVVRGQPRNVLTGEDWFNGLPEEEQRRIAGDGVVDLLQSGRAQLRDFVQRYDDPVFGQMIREASVKFVEGR